MEAFGKPHPWINIPNFSRIWGRGWAGPFHPHTPGADLNGEKEMKNEIQDTPSPWGMSYPKENHELMSDPPSLILPAAD